MFAGGLNSLKPTTKVFEHNQKKAEFGNAILIHNEQANFNDYQRFVVHELHKLIKTSHALISHTDGFIINPHNWDNHFLDYDWIGAPWPLWSHLQGVRQGNGGFNLRSKKLMELTATFNDYNPDKMPGQSGFEDQFICVHNKTKIEQANLKFAPLDMSAKFSLEHEIPEYRGRTTNDTFGFHGKFEPWQRYLAKSIL
jgi:hypothetical protein